MSSNAKDLRKQIKNVVQSTFPEIFTKEVQDQMVKQLSPMIDQGLSAIKEHLLANIEQHRNTTSAVENKILQAASDHLNEMNITMLAFQGVIADKLAHACVLDEKTFDLELAAKKELIKANLLKKSQEDKA